MFPMDFDHRILDSLPVPGEDATKNLLHTFKTIVSWQVMPHFRRNRGTDPLRLARVKESLSIRRLEDDGNKVRTISLIIPSEDGWSIFIHERIFDYISFLTPLSSAKPESRLGNGTVEERKMLVFAELVLRHQIEHILYPEREERDVIQSDLDFAMDKRTIDPTFYRLLMECLADEMNGIHGGLYLELFRCGEGEKPCDSIITRILNEHVKALGDLPGKVLHDVFPALDSSIKTRILGECYRKSRSSSFSLVQRASCFQHLLRLFGLLIRTNEGEALDVFDAFRGRWGLAVLFKEMDLPESTVLETDSTELFELFKSALHDLPDEFKHPYVSTPKPSIIADSLRPGASDSQPKPLRDRIEDARNDPRFPRQVLEVIDKNKLNAGGQSGAKYTELIEHLLAIPWGVIRKIEASPEEFERGLDKTHHGLERPKEIISDFFANLIWRYQIFREKDAANWHRTGSAFLFVGPPGVGKTSLAISIAENLGIPYHKLSLGGMRDESDIRGYGFTYEGSKPGPIVQGLIKMGAMNGMFIMDEADKTEQLALATLLEILDPEQNHLFHDKYTQTSIDIDLSNCHFILTANSLETVSPAVVNRCEVIFLDRYSVEEKIAIAGEHLIRRIREKYRIGEDEIYFEPSQESEILRYLIRNYTYEAGVRELERIIRTLFLRIHRVEVLANGKPAVAITPENIGAFLEEPFRPRLINADDRVGEMLALGVNVEQGIGSVIPIQVTRVRGGSSAGLHGSISMVHATGNLEKVMDESRKVATTGILHCAEELGLDLERVDDPIHIHFMGGSTKKDGPSSGGAIGLALASLLVNRKIRRDVAMTGEIDTKGRIVGIGALDLKLETAYAAGCKTMIIPKENLYGNGGIERFPDALKQELQILQYEEWSGAHEPFDFTRHMLQVVAVDDIVQAAEVAFIDDSELDRLEELAAMHARSAVEGIRGSGTERAHNLRLVYAGHPSDLDSLFIEPALADTDHKLILLVNSSTKSAFSSHIPELEGEVDIWEFDPAHDNLPELVRQIARTYAVDDLLTHQILSIEAPLDFLKHHRIHMDLSENAGAIQIRPFASNCTIERVALRGCRAFTNALFYHLTTLPQVYLDECPFLTRREGIYAIDLTFIPEKYRLDTQRCEEILSRVLNRWLKSMRELKMEHCGTAELSAAAEDKPLTVQH